jgi:hypothetical protein
MAVVRLTRVESENGKLPNVCMRCGAPADLYVQKRFSWRPSWVFILLLVNLLVYLVVALILEKRMKLRAPMCRAHQNHWMKRLIFNLIFGVVVLCSFVSIFVVPSALGLGRGQEDAIVGWICGGTLVLLLGWLVANIIIEQFMIRPEEITDRDMRLKGVHESFREALANWRIGEEGTGPREALPEVLPAEDRGQFYDPNARKQRPRDD